jgi:rhodanese-related sulfurtransferase
MKFKANNMNVDLKDFIRRIILFVTIMVIVAFLFNWISPQGISLMGKTKQILIGDEMIRIPVFYSQNKGGAVAAEFRMDQIDLTEAEKRFFSSDVIFIDARSSNDYREGHIPGAINIPVEEMEIFDLELFDFDRSQPFVCYCSDADCDLALRVAGWLEENGFWNLSYFPEGWEVWKSAGNQISRGKKP